LSHSSALKTRRKKQKIKKHLALTAKRAKKLKKQIAKKAGAPK